MGMRSVFCTYTIGRDRLNVYTFLVFQCLFSLILVIIFKVPSLASAFEKIGAKEKKLSRNKIVSLSLQSITHASKNYVTH